MVPAIPAWERSRPFLPILQVMLDATPWIAVHAAAIARDESLLASATTEITTGGDVGRSTCAVERDGDTVILEKTAPVISYGAVADYICTTARRGPDAEPSDQVLVVCPAGDTTLEQISTWDVLGFRGTCSPGFLLKTRTSAAHVLPVDYSTISASTMLPGSHTLWASVWLGIADSALSKARDATRSAVRNKPGATVPQAAKLAELTELMEAMEFRKAAVAIRAAWVLGNEYLQVAAPWTALKTDRDRAAVGQLIGNPAETFVHEIGHALGFVSGVDILDYYAGHGGPYDEDSFLLDPLDLFRYSTDSAALRVAAHRRGGDQILVGRQVLEDPAALEHLRDAELHAVLRGELADVLAHELHAAAGDLAALGLEQSADGLQGRALAGAVGAQQRHHPTLWHLDRDALDGEEDVVVDDLDVVERQRVGHRRLGRVEVAITCSLWRSRPNWP